MGVVGKEEPDAWLNAMRENLGKLRGRRHDGDQLRLHCLKIQHIGVRVGETVILDDVNLHAHCGELTAIIGRNGAGKSTLLKAILGKSVTPGRWNSAGIRQERGGA